MLEKRLNGTETAGFLVSCSIGRSIGSRLSLSQVRASESCLHFGNDYISIKPLCSLFQGVYVEIATELS